MIKDHQKWDSAFIEGKQLFSGYGLIIFALVYIVSDILIIIRDKRKKR